LPGGTRSSSASSRVDWSSLRAAGQTVLGSAWLACFGSIPDVFGRSRRATPDIRIAIARIACYHAWHGPQDLWVILQDMSRHWPTARSSSTTRGHLQVPAVLERQGYQSRPSRRRAGDERVCGHRPGAPGHAPARRSTASTAVSIRGGGRSQVIVSRLFDDSSRGQAVQARGLRLCRSRSRRTTAPAAGAIECCAAEGRTGRPTPAHDADSPPMASCTPWGPGSPTGSDVSSSANAPQGVVGNRNPRRARRGRQAARVAWTLGLRPDSWRRAVRPLKIVHTPDATSRACSNRDHGLVPHEVASLSLETQGSCCACWSSGEINGGPASRPGRGHPPHRGHQPRLAGCAGEESGEDLYYRLTWSDSLPRCAERRADIPDSCATPREVPNVDATGPAALTRRGGAAVQHPGPQRRELKNVSSDSSSRRGGTIREEHLPGYSSSANRSSHRRARTNAELKAMRRRLHDRVCGDIERVFVLDALRRNNWREPRREGDRHVEANFHALMRNTASARRNAPVSLQIQCVGARHTSGRRSSRNRVATGCETGATVYQRQTLTALGIATSTCSPPSRCP